MNKNNVLIKYLLVCFTILGLSSIHLSASSYQEDRTVLTMNQSAVAEEVNSYTNELLTSIQTKHSLIEHTFWNTKKLTAKNKIDLKGNKAYREDGIPLIFDSYSVDYRSYIPDTIAPSETITNALDITNPELSIDASSAILFDSNTKDVLYYKNPVVPIFPASTAKLLSSLIGLDWCSTDEEVTVGDEITMIAYDSSKAKLVKGQILTIETVLEGMLLPSGNDAAYVLAAYVGRKSLDDKKASKEDAIDEFVKLMNEKAEELGAKNSNFMTPDGYDALGQYTTAYDMGMIGLAAIDNKAIQKIVKKTSVTERIVSGETLTWQNTNALINEDSVRYYPYAIGLKTGTTTMAGRCIIAAGKKDDKKVVCVIMNSTSAGRWNDAKKLLKYALE